MNEHTLASSGPEAAPRAHPFAAERPRKIGLVGPAPVLSPSVILSLQRTAGNGLVTRALQRSAALNRWCDPTVASCPPGTTGPSPTGREEAERQSLPEEHEPGSRETAEEVELAQAGLIATGRVLEAVVGAEAQTLRAAYNQGAARIAAERARLLAQGLPEAEIAQRLATMRHELALEIRRTGSSLLRQAAEVIDSVRGQARPTYESLRATGKTDAQIIRSAARTNGFVNSLPRALRWTGRGFVFASAGISLYIILDAPVEEQGAVAQREIEGLVGGTLGAAAFQGICVLTGIATEGLGLVICGLIGGVVGFEGAREGQLLQLLDIAPHTAPGQSGTLYRIEGDFDASDFLLFSVVHRRVRREEGVLVMATGERSGELVGGRGHYRSLQVMPVSDPATQLFEGQTMRWVPEYLLHPITAEDLRDADQER